MKKILLLALVTITLFSCRVTKSLTMMSAKQAAEMPEIQFLNKKFDAVKLLYLTDEQKSKCEEIWKEEKAGLNMPLLKNENIAPVIYKSELDFRKVLTNEQLENYKYLMKDNFNGVFLNDSQLAEVKRIYIDK